MSKGLHNHFKKFVVLFSFFISYQCAIAEFLPPSSARFPIQKVTTFRKVRFQWILLGDLLHVLERPRNLITSSLLITTQLKCSKLCLTKNKMETH